MEEYYDEWGLDALVVVQGICSKEDPSSWKTWSDLLHSRFGKNRWNLSWCESNLVIRPGCQNLLANQFLICFCFWWIIYSGPTICFCKPAAAGWILYLVIPLCIGSFLLKKKKKKIPTTGLNICHNHANP